MGDPHQFMPNSAPQIKRTMLEEMGLHKIDPLFSSVDPQTRLQRNLNLPVRQSELEARRNVEDILGLNRSARDLICFLGGGVWPHYVPAVVDEVVRRGEFLTSYTPYQPEISQGLLQALFEYQSLICELLAMDYANSSMYDWASSIGEAARMASRVTGREEFLVPHFISPDRLETLRAYCSPTGIKVLEFHQDLGTGRVSMADFESKLSERTAGVYLENPSYFGFLERDGEAVSAAAHKAGALFVMGVDPISTGIIKPPGEFEADIAVGEGQPLGLHMNFGGPLLGVFCCRGERLLRHMPGRLIGMTSTVNSSSRAFTMALQTREQHVRRGKASSNICTNEALCALAAATYLCLLGPEGIRKLCLTILERSHYAMSCLQEISGLTVPLIDAPHFKEFTVNFDKTGFSAETINRRLLEFGIHGGIPLKGRFPELGETALFCVTEIHMKRDVDRLAESLRSILGGR